MCVECNVLNKFDKTTFLPLNPPFPAKRKPRIVCTEMVHLKALLIFSHMPKVAENGLCNSGEKS